MKECENRNCKNKFEYKSNKKFCCKSCKNKEAVYRVRDKKKNEKTK